MTTQDGILGADGLRPGFSWAQTGVWSLGLDKSVTGQTTRSAAAVDLWDRIPGSIVVIGNAPTALFRLLERMEQEHLRPAAIIAVPVGFIGAAESKQALVNSGTDTPYVTLLGRRGGTAIAAAAMNAIILSLPENEENPQ